jgi:DNA helicase II / ATP-dependent DNA helicase PcrA
VDSTVVFAVAGSGKTSSLVASLKPDERSLLLTYTENNFRTLHDKIARVCGGIPENVHLSTYFSFLYSFCVRPYLRDEMRLRGINWDQPSASRRRFGKTDERYYIDAHRRLYYGRMADLLRSRQMLGMLNARLARYFDRIYIDEVQDFAGHDFNLLCDILVASTPVVAVGDFYQHTFDTSRDGSVNKSLHDDEAAYRRRFESLGCSVDVTTLSKSYRCSAGVCDFVSQHLGISIESQRSEQSSVHVVDSEALADELFFRDDVVKLFYSEHYKYPCHSNNWGAAKGMDDYGDVCVVLNKTTAGLFQRGSLATLNPATKNKLYVACTRAAKDLFIVPGEYYMKFKRA